jgi:hypothetical protein
VIGKVFTKQIAVPAAPAQPPSVPELPDRPAVRPPPPRPSPDGQEPEWLERNSLLPQAPPTAVDPELERLGADIARDPAGFVRELLGASRPADFARLVTPLGVVLRTWAQAGETEALWRIACTLDMIASDAQALPGSRAVQARACLDALFDARLLKPLGARALGGDETAGASAAYSGRVKKHDPGARAIFVAMLREIGAAGLPAIGAALEHLEPRLKATGAAGIVQDLLAALPPVLDDRAREVLAKLAQSPVQGLARAAGVALARGSR